MHAVNAYVKRSSQRSFTHTQFRVHPINKVDPKKINFGIYFFDAEFEQFRSKRAETDVLHTEQSMIALAYFSTPEIYFPKFW